MHTRCRLINWVCWTHWNGLYRRRFASSPIGCALFSFGRAPNLNEWICDEREREENQVANEPASRTENGSGVGCLMESTANANSPPSAHRDGLWHCMICNQFNVALVQHCQQRRPLLQFYSPTRHWKKKRVKICRAWHSSPISMLPFDLNATSMY